MPKYQPAEIVTKTNKQFLFVCKHCCTRQQNKQIYSVSASVTAEKVKAITSGSKKSDVCAFSVNAKYHKCTTS